MERCHHQHHTAMRNLLVVFLLIIVLFAGCKEGGLFERKIKIKGTIARDGKYKGSGKGFTLQDATKVLIFYGIEYDLAEIKNDGTFTGKAPLGRATVVAFLTKNNEFIGNLFMKGINFLPLAGASDDLNVIDLSTLTQDSNRIIPANDPIGSQIILSQQEMEFMKQVGAYYEALAKNLDMDNNGITDLLEEGRIAINTSQNFNAGTFGVNSTLPVTLHPDSLEFNATIHIVGPIGLLSSQSNTLPENAIVTGPLGNPYNDIRNAGNSYSNNKEFKLNFSRAPHNGAYGPPFGPGEYTLEIDNQTFTFHYSNISMSSYVVMVIPTLQTNSNGDVTSISMEYQLPDGTPVNPRKLLASEIMVQVNDTSYAQLVEIRGSGKPQPESYNYYSTSLPDPISLGKILSISLIYTDLFGNEVSNGWMAQ
jgi:hypothetical protein